MRRHQLRRWSVILIVALGVAQARGGGTAPEYDVKAAFLYRFATYIRWPARAGVARTPFVIAIMGKDPFGSALTEVVRGQKVNGRTIRITRPARAEDALPCDVVFVSATERGKLQQILTVLRGAPILTVGDMDRFAEQGGMIGLVTSADQRVRFDINTAALERAGLKAPSQLLQLARIVDEEGPH